MGQLGLQRVNWPTWGFKGAAIDQFGAAKGQLGAPKCLMRATVGQVGAPTVELGALIDELGVPMGK